MKVYSALRRIVSLSVIYLFLLLLLPIISDEIDLWAQSGAAGEKLQNLSKSNQSLQKDLSVNQFTEQTSILLPGVGQSSVSWMDYDNDGDLDILLTGHSFDGNLISKIFKNNGDGSFTEQTSIRLNGVGYSSAAWGDYDNDGDLDLFLMGTSDWFGENMISKIYKNNGNGTFSELTSFTLPGIQSGSAAWGDYDNDGDLDLLLTGYSIDGIMSKIYKNNEGNNFSEDFAVVLEGVYYGSAAWGDYDNDGDQDILLTGNNGYNPVSKIYKNNGDGTFTDETTVHLTGVWQSSCAWCDYDNDGDLDILLTGDSDNMNYVSKIYRNNGDGTFSELTSTSLTGVADGSAIWGDYDNDGWSDILLTGLTSSGVISKIYRNNKDGSFSDETSILLKGVQRSSAAWGDYDNDGDLDLLLTGFTGNDFVSCIYKNNCSAANNPPLAPDGLASSVIGDYVVFNWNKSTDAQTPQNGLHYNIVISDAPGGVNKLSPMSDRKNGYRKLAKLGNAQANSSTIFGLTDGTYYWSVQAIDGAFAGSSFPAEQTFTVSVTPVIPGIPVPVIAYPAGGVTIYSNSPILAWNVNQNTSGVKFNLQLSESANFSESILNIDNIDAHYYEASALGAGKIYYWRVRAKSSLGDYGEFSSPGSFRITSQNSQLSVTPTLVYPTGGVTVYTASPIFNWYINQWVPSLKYQLQLALTNDFADPILDVTNKDGLSYQAAGLSAGVTYYSRIRSFAADGNYSLYSSTDSFTVNKAIGTQALTPVFTYPTGGITVYTGSPILNWYIAGYAPNQKYNLQVSLKPDFSNLFLNEDDIASSQYQITNLSPGVTYYTRVRGKAQDGTYSLFSSIGSFTVYAGNNPAVPIAASPTGGVRISGNSATLSWYFPANSSVKQHYDLQISTNGDFSDAAQFTNLDSLSYMIKGLKSESKYFWRVRSKTLDGKASEYSNEGSFFTSKISNIAFKTDHLIPKEYSLHQNYPNPFNPATTIEFSVAKDEWVRLQIFDMIGRIARELLNENLSAGNYKFTFNASELSSGVYIYKLTTPSVNITKKMILQK